MLKHALIIMLSLYSLAAHSQPSRNLKNVLSRIKGIPIWYTKGYTYEVNPKDFKNVDSTYLAIAKMDTIALHRLWSALSDTTFTAIPNTCESGSLTYGQLAFMLINDIEHVPYALVTQLQWCTIGECGVFPNGFLSYLKNYAGEFQEKYRMYLGSRERQKYLRELRKINKKVRK